MIKIKNSLWEDEKKERRTNAVTVSVFGVIIAFLLAIILLFSFVWFSVQVKGESMENTLYDEDFLLVDKSATPKGGDIVIIENVRSYWLIKRVIAVEGETVQIKDGSVYVNGEKLDEPYVKGKTYPHEYPHGEEILTVGEGEIFFMGDNREDSADSRSFGTVSVSNVVGVVMDWSVATKDFRNFLYRIFSPIASCGSVE